MSTDANAVYQEEWISDDCVIEDELGHDIYAVLNALQTNRQIRRIMRYSKRNWLLDPILLLEEIKDRLSYWKQELFYLWLDLLDLKKELIYKIKCFFRR